MEVKRLLQTNSIFAKNILFLSVYETDIFQIVVVGVVYINEWLDVELNSASTCIMHLYTDVL